MQAHRERAAPLPAPSHALGRPLIAGVLLLEVNRELPLRVQAFSTSARGRIFSSSRHTGGPPAGTEACTPASPLASFRADAHKPAPLAPLVVCCGRRGPAGTGKGGLKPLRARRHTPLGLAACLTFRMPFGCFLAGLPHATTACRALRPAQPSPDDKRKPAGCGLSRRRWVRSGAPDWPGMAVATARARACAWFS